MRRQTLLALFSVTLIALALLVSTVWADITVATSTPAAERAPADADRVITPANKPGFYLETSLYSPPPPAASVGAVGSYRFWDWASLNPAPGVYRFNTIDQWITTQVAAGYTSLGFTLMTYTGRGTSCSAGLGAENTPDWVRDGPDGISGTVDDPIIISQVRDSRDCNGNGSPDNTPWPLLDYWDPYYIQQYTTFVNALAQHLISHPERNRFAWVSMGVGKDGENKPVDDRDDDTLLSAGYDIAKWVQFVEDVIDIYRNAFYTPAGAPLIPVVTQNAPFYREFQERRDIANYAAARGVGLSINGITADFNYVERCSDPSDRWNCTGIWDQARLHYTTVPVGFETYGYMMPTVNEFYWGMARALDGKADFIRMSNFWDYGPIAASKTENLIIAEWAAKYLGTGLQSGDATPPSIWSRMREHRIPCFYGYAAPEDCNFWPTVGNYEFYLKQLHTAPGGVTIPITNDSRVTKTGWDYTGSTVTDKRWHYNTSPYSSILPPANLTNPSTGLQIEAQPGWVVRRSDQATNNSFFFFDADNRYLSPPANPAQPHIAVITVAYLDRGGDRWSLKVRRRQRRKNRRGVQHPELEHPRGPGSRRRTTIHRHPEPPPPVRAEE